MVISYMENGKYVTILNRKKSSVINGYDYHISLSYPCICLTNGNMIDPRLVGGLFEFGGSRKTVSRKDWWSVSDILGCRWICKSIPLLGDLDWDLRKAPGKIIPKWWFNSGEKYSSLKQSRLDWEASWLTQWSPPKAWPTPDKTILRLPTPSRPAASGQAPFSKRTLWCCRTKREQISWVTCCGPVSHQFTTSYVAIVVVVVVVVAVVVADMLRSPPNWDKNDALMPWRCQMVPFFQAQGQQRSCRMNCLWRQFPVERPAIMKP